MTTNTPEPWERQPGESDRAFEAFRLYRDLGPSRTLDRAGELVSPREGPTGAQGGAQDGAQPGRKRGATGCIRGWAAKHHWAERAGAWDAHLDRERRAAAERAEAEEVEDFAKARRQWNKQIRQAASFLAARALKAAASDAGAASLRAAGEAIKIADGLIRAAIDDGEARSGPPGSRPGWRPVKTVEIRLNSAPRARPEDLDDDDDDEELLEALHLNGNGG
jgi:hypothetical protein